MPRLQRIAVGFLVGSGVVACLVFLASLARDLSDALACGDAAEVVVGTVGLVWAALVIAAGAVVIWGTVKEGQDR